MGTQITTGSMMTCSEHRPVLIVIAGPNGSGKTSVTSRLLQHEWMEDAVYVNPDIVAQERFGDWNSAEAVMKSIKYCEELREQCLAEKRSLIFETVLSVDDKVEYIRRAKLAGYFVRFFFVCTVSPTINAARIARRVMEGGHDVPIAKIISRYNKSIARGAVVCHFADRAYIYDNSVDNAEARLLFRLSYGRVVKKYSGDIPEWAQIML